jgi:hypothetical protein
MCKLVLSVMLLIIYFCMLPYLESVVGFPCRVIGTHNYTYESLTNPWHMDVTVDINGHVTETKHVYCGAMLKNCKQGFKPGTFRQCFITNHQVRLVDLDVLSIRFVMLSLALILTFHFII